MKESESKKASNGGSFLAALAVLLGIAAGYLAWLQQQDLSPTSEEAQLLFNGEIMATFEGQPAAQITENLAAVATVSGYGKQLFRGVVKIVHKESPGKILTMIRLKDPPPDAKPPVPCHVTVVVPRLTKN